jgi:PAS domain S-box-containing protein
MEVQNARHSLQTTLTSIADAVISTDTTGRIVFVNPVAQSLLRLKENQILGKHIDRVFHTIDESSRKSVEVPIHRVLRNRAVVGPAEHTVLVAADGTELPIDESAAPIRDARGEMMGVVLVFRDVSSRRATEKLLEDQAAELRERAQLLKEADERKNEFLAMLAHELRNPLAPIRNAAQVLLSGKADGNHRWVGEVVERQTQYLARLVDDLLDVSRITRGNIILRPETLDLAAIIKRAVETSGPMIKARKHKLELTLPDKPVRLRGDLTRLVQVVGNLLNNAAKFTKDGGRIQLRAEQIGKEVIIRVTDNGIGLTAELKPHVFELFTQADKTLDRSQGGLGVGLTVASSLAELHGGSIEANSDGPGKGSEFTVRLPALEAGAVDETTALPQNGNGTGAHDPLRVLVLEDNIDSADMLRVMLELDGYNVEIASDGTVGLAAADVFKPNVVLCDIGLPGMSGYEVALALRANPAFNATRLIALSGYGQEEDRRRSREAGFDFHLAKPVEPKVLLTLLRSI